MGLPRFYLRKHAFRVVCLAGEGSSFRPFCSPRAAATVRCSTEIPAALLTEEIQSGRHALAPGSVFVFAGCIKSGRADAERR